MVGLNAERQEQAVGNAPLHELGAWAEPCELSFIIPVRNDADGLARCLKSIAVAATGRKYEAIVVDNGSIDGSGDRALALGARVFRLHGRVACLRNAAAKVASGRLLAFVDADHEIDERWASSAIDLLTDRSVVAAGAPYHPPEFGSWVQHSYNLLRNHSPGIHEAAWLGSGNLVVRRQEFEAIGGFDQSLETCEDVDLCQRLAGHGFRVVADSRLRSTHHGDPSSLRQLFLSELWRGRDNVRVSLRRPALRDLPSVAIPIVDLVAVIAAAAALVGLGRQGVPVALTAIGIIATLASLRATTMALRADAPTFLTLGRIWSVAFLYDLGRALALVVRAPHRRASRPGAE